MAAYTAACSVHKTLGTTVADDVTLGTAGILLSKVEVGNPITNTAIIYFTLSRSTIAPTTAVSRADDTFFVYPGSALAIDFGGDQVSIVRLSIVGVGNDYNIGTYRR